MFGHLWNFFGRRQETRGDWAGTTITAPAQQTQTAVEWVSHTAHKRICLPTIESGLGHLREELIHRAVREIKETLERTHSPWNVRNIGNVRLTPHPRFVLTYDIAIQYELKTTTTTTNNYTEGFEDMTIPLPNYLLDLIEQPADDIVQRNLTKTHLFNDVMQSIRAATPEDDVFNNDLAALQSKNFQSHPNMHRGYYDSKRDGVLYVKDREGNSIRKDTAVLLHDGSFLPANSPLLCNLGSTTFTNKVRRALDGDTAALAFFTDKKRFIKPKGYHIYVPFELNQMRLVVETRVLPAIFKKLLEVYEAEGADTHFDLDDTEDITQDFYNDLKAIYARVFEEGQHDHIRMILRDNSRIMPMLNPTAPEIADRYFIIPDDADFFAGYAIESRNYGDAFGRRVNDALAQTGVEYQPLLYLNYTPDSGIRMVEPGRPIAGDIENNTIRLTQDLNIEYNFPIGLAIKGTVAHNAGNNRPTQNNEGVRLNYSADVLAYKKGFLMSPSEEAQFKVNTKDMRSVLKAHRMEKAKLMATYNNEDLDGGTRVKARDKAGKLSPPMMSLAKRPIHMGVEIEILPRGDERNEEGARSVIRDIANSGFGNHAIIKADSSIGDYGFEIVTVPATLNYHRTMFEEHFFKTETNIHKRLMSTDRCGIHVHITKEAFTRLSLGKFVAFINSPENSEFMDAMANRAPTHYCQRMTLKGKNKNKVDVSAVLAKKVSLTRATAAAHDNDVRRAAVNIMCSQKTIEVRIFKSSNTKNNILRKIEFCHALCLFARSRSLQQMTVYDFVDFLLEKENKKEYSYLVKWLAHKGYVGHEKAKIKGRSKLVHVYGTNKITQPDSTYHAGLAKKKTTKQINREASILQERN